MKQNCADEDVLNTVWQKLRDHADRDLNKNRDNNMEANFIALNDKDVVSFYEASKEKKTVIISMLKSASVPLQTTLWKIFFSNIVSLIDHNVGYRCLEEVANVTKSDTYINIKKIYAGKEARKGCSRNEVLLSASCRACTA
ncbi:hypothetical protein QR680_003143 [Steinernema hermaphroditum]|uniref:Uncharacterized protein n=1 Tax=Steinernema hermaphroditum TaxID=289476 RepID=A0AA39LJI6_9BILA|nr:hypothetical protein QR680_003143 [Steinernema hermaphroditum]